MNTFLHCVLTRVLVNIRATRARVVVVAVSDMQAEAEVYILLCLFFIGILFPLQTPL